MLKRNPKIRSLLTIILSITLMAAGILALTNPEIPRSYIGAGGQNTGDGYTL